MKKCLYCYKAIEKGDFHEKCSFDFFGSKTPPKLEYNLKDMASLAKNVVGRSIAVPGVQPKLSMSLVDESSNKRLTVVGALGGDYIFKPPSLDYEQMTENEWATCVLASLNRLRDAEADADQLQDEILNIAVKDLCFGSVSFPVECISMDDKHAPSYMRSIPTHAVLLFDRTVFNSYIVVKGESSLL